VRRDLPDTAQPKRSDEAQSREMCSYSESPSAFPLFDETIRSTIRSMPRHGCLRSYLDGKSEAPSAGIVLIVDDEPAGRRTLELALSNQRYDLVSCASGVEALARAAERFPDVVLLDVMMPGMDGMEVCRRLRADELLAEVPVIMVTALDDRDTRLAGLESGADEFLTKPIDFAEVRTRVRTITRLNRYRKIAQNHADLLKAYDATLEGWIYLLDLRDRESKGHTERVTEMTVLLAEAAGFPQDCLPHVRRGALLHDVGKLGIPDAIFQKQGRLTPDEMEIMQTHPTLAFRMLSPIPFLHPALDIPICHHERYDGAGYPRGLGGDVIPLVARLFAVVDVWDALTNDLVYRAAYPRDQALKQLEELSGSHFDPAAVQLFLALEARLRELPPDADYLRKSQIAAQLIPHADVVWA
jgi:putative two-component system response regulator